MAVTTEIAPNVYRISIFAPWANLQFNHFLVKDDEPLLFHTGLRGMHAEIRDWLPRFPFAIFQQPGDRSLLPPGLFHPSAVL